MSLQGTLDTFSLPDVLRLLASTRKTGHLRLDGDRGTAGLWFVDGAVAAVAPPAADPGPPGAESLCDVLRCLQGTFVFEAGTASPLADDPEPLEPLLDQAEGLLVEWRALTAVVPSLDCGLRLRPELEGGTATVTAEQWRLLVAVAGGTTVGALGAAQRLGELAVSRAVKDLVEAGLAEVDHAPAPHAGPAPAPALAPAPERAPAPAPAPAPVAEAPVDETQEELVIATAPAPEPEPAPPNEPGPPPAPVADGFRRRPLGTGPAGPRGPAMGMPLSASLGELASLGDSKRPFPGSTRPSGDDDQAEVARRLADLGPDAAAKVAAAAGAATPEERDAALDAIEAEVPGEPVNRSALLKFLSSVRS